MTKKQPVYTRRCKCGTFIPDDYETCNFCLLKLYDLSGRTFDCLGMFTYYSEDDVVAALRRAEKA